MRWAILGTGYVARKFVLGLRASRMRPEVTVVASRQEANAKAFAADFGIPNASNDYALAVSSPDVDIVYIATPPAQHLAHALAAIGNGKAVLVEKPFAMNGAEAREIAAAARSAGVFCMEAMWSRFQPLTTALKSKIDNGALGTLCHFHGSFAIAERPDGASNAFDPAAGGGALLGRAVYPISLARHFLGPVSRVEASAHIGSTGVDEDCALLLTHRSGALSTLTASLRSNGPNDGHLCGTDGRVSIKAPLYRPFAADIMTTRARGSAGGGGRFEAIKEGSLAQGAQQRLQWALRAVMSLKHRHLRTYYSGNGYHYEADAVMSAVAEGQLEHATMPIDETIEVMDIIDAARASWQKAASA